jgi:phage-related protein
MERLLADASKLSGVQFNIESYSDIIDAIHVIQDNMGITGTTAEEAAKTVSGSIGMMQAAWTNLLNELGKPDGDVEARMEELITSIFGDGTENNPGVVGNVIPLVERILSGMGKAIGDFAMRAGEYFMEHRTEIYDKVGQFILEALKAIVTAIPYIVEGIAYLVASLIEYVVTHIPEMLDAAGRLMLAFLTAIANAAYPAMTAINQIGENILNGIGNFFNDMFNAGANIIKSLIDGILSGLKPLGDALASVGDFIVSHKGPPSYDAVMLKPNAELIMGGLTDTIIDSIPALNRAMKMVNGAISLDVGTTPALATAGASTSVGVGSTINVYVEGRADEDYNELGRRIGSAVAFEAKMQGVF